jgi:hypothetical protein
MYWLVATIAFFTGSTLGAMALALFSMAKDPAEKLDHGFVTMAPRPEGQPAGQEARKKIAAR